MGGGIVVGPPKSRAGLRTFAVPTAIRTEIVGYLAEFVDAGPDALVFTGVQGRALRAALIYQRATSEADQRIADRLSALVEGREIDTDDQEDDEDGPAGSRVPVG
jgi:hypothetical protein